jgi:biopolymer transport protein ExbB
VGGEAAVDQALREQSPALERSLGLLGVLGTVAPFLGLLGTVTGLIRTFGTLTAVGSNDPRVLAGGISEALITTQAGLIVAIPILLVHAYLTHRVDDVADRLEDAAEAAATASARTEADA